MTIFLNYRFRCSLTGICVPSGARCNYTEECGDGSDEDGCDAGRTCKPAREFRCDDGRCVAKSAVCDGTADCADGSDEQHCSRAPGDCDPATQFACQNGRCVSLSWVCNRRDDCGDYSDEGGVSFYNFSSLCYHLPLYLDCLSRSELIRLGC